MKGVELVSLPLFRVAGLLRNGRYGRFGRLEENEEAVDAFDERRRCSEELRSVSSYSSDSVRTREPLLECAGVGRGVGLGVVEGVFVREVFGDKWYVGGTYGGRRTAIVRFAIPTSRSAGWFVRAPISALHPAPWVTSMTTNSSS